MTESSSLRIFTKQADCRDFCWFLMTPNVRALIVSWFSFLSPVTVYGAQGFSSFKQNYLDDFWETKNIDIEDNTPERSFYSLETVDGQLHIKIINDRDYPLGLPDVSLPPSKNYVSLGDTWKYNDKNLDFGVNFPRLDFDDSSWLSAPGIFGVDTRAFPAPGLIN